MLACRSLTRALQPNHLLGYRRTCLQLFFSNTNDLFAVRREVLPIVAKNKANMDAVDAYAEVVGGETADGNGMDVDFGDDESTAFVPQAARMGGKSQLASDFLIDIREYDVSYCLRVAIDKGASQQVTRNRTHPFERHSLRSMVHCQLHEWRNQHVLHFLPSRA